MIKARDLFEIYPEANYIVADGDGKILLCRTKPKLIKEDYYYNPFGPEVWWEVDDGSLVEEFGGLHIKEFTEPERWYEYIIEREKEKPLKTYNDFVKWLKTKGDVDERRGYFFKKNNKENIGIWFLPVDVNLKINDIKLCAIFITAKFYTGTPEQCKRVIEAMLEE